MYYNGLPHADIMAPNGPICNGIERASSSRPTPLAPPLPPIFPVAPANLQVLADFIEWTKFGGIVGRGVLLDYVAYAERHNIQYDPTSRFTISVADLDTMISEQNVTLKIGDILLIRSGTKSSYS
jgi:Putative cyclase